MHRIFATTTVLVSYISKRYSASLLTHSAGPGSGKNYTLMQPVLNAIVQRLVDGPNKTYVNSNGQSWSPGPLIPMFTNDGQINQLAAEIGVFDQQKPLPNNKIPNDQVREAPMFFVFQLTDVSILSVDLCRQQLCHYAWYHRLRAAELFKQQIRSYRTE